MHHLFLSGPPGVIQIASRFCYECFLTLTLLRAEAQPCHPVAMHAMTFYSSRFCLVLQLGPVCFPGLGQILLR